MGFIDAKNVCVRLGGQVKALSALYPSSDQCFGFDNVFFKCKSNPKKIKDLVKYPKIQIKSKSNPNLYDLFNILTKFGQIQIQNPNPC